MRSSCALFVLLFASAARAQPADLDFVIPEGFVELARDGVPTDRARSDPGLTELAATKDLKLIAARFKKGNEVSATFQVVLRPPMTFDDSSIDRFANKMLEGMTQAGLEPKVQRKEVITLAGRKTGRVAMVGKGRRMLFYGVPDGGHTAVLLYSATEQEFSSLFPVFERSANATKVVESVLPTAPGAMQPPSAAPLAAPIEAAPPGEPAPSVVAPSEPASSEVAAPASAITLDSNWLAAIIIAVALALVGAVIFWLRPRKSS